MPHHYAVCICRTTQAHASTRSGHASCVMRAQQHPLLHPSPRSKHHPCCSSTMMIMMILCSTCVCVIITQSTKVCTRLALPSRNVYPHLLVSLGLIAAHCLLLIVSCPFILCFVVLLSSQCYHCSRCPYLSTCSHCSH